MDITKAIIPAAGLGTRFLPYTKAIPKEMLPLLNKPAIQYIIEECLASNVKDFFLITSRNKQAIANHLDSDPGLEHALQEHGKLDLLSSINRIIRAAQFTYIRQSETLGLGHAIWLARHSIGKEYFSVLLPDDIIAGKMPGLAQLMRIAQQEKASVVAVQEVPHDLVSNYGVVSIKKQITPNLFQVGHLVEKPDSKDTPSNLAIIGRYVLSHKIFQALDEISGYATNELQLTDGITQMMKHNEKVFAYKIQGVRYDIGNPIGWLKASIGLALQNAEYGPHIKRYIDELNTPQSFLYDNNKNIAHYE
jgi:UTP--glucose-1-phosphate uridylyltransferase